MKFASIRYFHILGRFWIDFLTQILTRNKNISKDLLIDCEKTCDGLIIVPKPKGVLPLDPERMVRDNKGHNGIMKET
jgi:hypothetical protein